MARTKIQRHERQRTPDAVRRSPTTDLAIRSNIGKSHRGQKLNQWNPENMKKTIEEYQSHLVSSNVDATASKLSLRALARAWQLPYRTLRNRIAGKVMRSTHASGRPTVLGEDAEKHLVDVITEMAQVGFPLTRMDIKQLAYDYAKQIGLQCFSDKKNQCRILLVRWFHEEASAIICQKS
jgi:hypothetical protein